MPGILDCPDCDWTTKPKHKRPQQALTQHRNSAHGNGATAEPAPGGGYLVTFTNGEEQHVPAEEHQETMDRHWFFWGGALKETFKRMDVREVVPV